LGPGVGFANGGGAPAFRMCRENAPVAPLGCLPMRRCGRKKGLLMVESSGCAAFGHPAAIQGSLPTTIGRRLERRQRAVRPVFGVATASDQSRCPCRARLVSLAAGASRVPPAGSVATPAACSGLRATTTVSREKRRPRLGRCRTVTGRRSCYDRASRAKSILATLRRRATPCAVLAHSAPARPRAMGCFRVPQRLFHSTAIRPLSGRAVPYRPRGDSGRPRAGVPSRV
jgi:hypothetical protein